MNIKHGALVWDQIRYFVAVTRAGSVVGAARALGVSHATVLRNVSRLEKQLGVRLFDRLRSGYRITAEGEEIYADAQLMEEHAETLMRRAMGRNPIPEGLLKLIVPDNSLFDLMPLLGGFRRENPRIDLSVEIDSAAADQGVAQLKADVAIVVTNTPPEDLVGRQLKRINFAYYASPAYLGRQPALGQQLADSLPLDQCDWITWDLPTRSDSSQEPGWQLNLLRRLTRRPRIALRTSSHADTLSAVRAGLGVGLLQTDHQHGLVELPIAVPVDPVGVWMLTHQVLRRSGKVRAFMEFVVDWLDR
jgi:DNA-binding transcriptional LysR family regulator